VLSLDITNRREEERLTMGDGFTDLPGSFSGSGDLFIHRTSTGEADIFVATSTGSRAPRPLVTGPGNQRAPQLSQDERWLAYTSNESGQYQVYVQPYPSLDRKWQISAEGGTEPRWSPTGGELFFRNGDRFMAVDVTTRGTFSAGIPHMLFQGRGVATPTNTTGYDVSLDGQRFLMSQPVESDPPVTRIDLVFNWFDELRRVVPAR
jgi:hypothetical protein